MTILVVTGGPGIGKSTIVMGVAEALKSKGLKVGGIVASEVKRNNKRVGFEIIDLLSGEKAILASTTGNGPRVGKYAVNLEGCHFAAERLMEAIRHSDVIICDELGPMEFKSKKFVDCAASLLEADKVAIVVVHKRLSNTVIDRFKMSANFTIDIDLKNRDETHRILLEKV